MNRTVPAKTASASSSEPTAVAGLGRNEYDSDHDRSHEEHKSLGGAGAERARFGQRGSLDRQRYEQQAGQRAANGGQCSAEAAPCPRHVIWPNFRLRQAPLDFVSASCPQPGAFVRASEV